MKQQQLQLPFVPERTHGGLRAGAGRKARRQGVSHVSRLDVSKHVSRVMLRGIELAQRDDFRMVHFTIQHDHVHLLVEADGSDSLANGMKGLVCGLARGANRAWGRKGKVFPERYHDLVLKTLRQVRNALRYILNNHRKHFVGVQTIVDKLSSADDFDGWSDYRPAREAGGIGSIVRKACSWMIRKGWRAQYGLIPVESIPGTPWARSARALT